MDQRLSGAAIYVFARRSALAGMLASLMLGGVLIVEGVPRLIAEILMLPGNRTLAAIETSNAVREKDIETLVASRQFSLHWTDDGRARTDLATANLLLADSEVDAAIRRKRISEAVHLLREGLAMAPANSYAWARLAYVSLITGEPVASVAALRMAIKTASVEPSLTFPRLELCLIAWPYFEPSDSALLTSQVQLGWRQSPDELVELARVTGRVAAVRESLSDIEQIDFDRRLIRAQASTGSASSR